MWTIKDFHNTPQSFRTTFNSIPPSAYPTGTSTAAHIGSYWASCTNLPVHTNLHRRCTGAIYIPITNSTSDTSAGAALHTGLPPGVSYTCTKMYHISSWNATAWSTSRLQPGLYPRLYLHSCSGPPV